MYSSGYFTKVDFFPFLTLLKSLMVERTLTQHFGFAFWAVLLTAGNLILVDALLPAFGADAESTCPHFMCTFDSHFFSP
jgi:hypothetical protein